MTLDGCGVSKNSEILKIIQSIPTRDVIAKSWQLCYFTELICEFALFVFAWKGIFEPPVLQKGSR
jgi:hypothetical protein